MNQWERIFLYRKKRLLPRMYQLLNGLAGLTCFCAVLFLATLVYEHGFMISSSEAGIIQAIYKGVWIIFLLSVTAQLFFQREGEAKFTIWGWILDILFYFTLVPVLFKQPEVEHSGAYWIWTVFHSSYYRKGILFLLSLFTLSSNLVRLLGKRTNPSLILASGFLFIILVGTGLLMLPRCTYNGISWIDAFFTATSATCVTGLVSVDVPSTFTLEGQIVIILLIQIGGLGVMTLTSFFAMFFMGNTSLYNQLVVGDMISSNSLNSLLSTLLYILGFTLAIEAAGMLVIWYSIHDTLGMSINQELYFSAFHAVSAFCNAGFSTLPGNLGNPAVMHDHNLLYITVACLIVLGGIGFPILVNLKDTLFYYVRYVSWKFFGRSSVFSKRVHLYQLNTRIVLVMTALLLVVGTLAIAAFEWNRAFAGMPAVDKWVHAFFNSACPRTAGFTSVGLTTLSVQTLLLMVVLMIIGGGTQSTAGGVKINVFAVVLLNLWAIIRGADRVTVFRRELSHDSIRRSNAALMLYLIIVFAGIFVMTLLEPQASVMALVFECVSALSTVGSSLDLTPTLSVSGKLLIAFLMFTGRVGAFTLVLGLIKQVKKRNYHYPSDNIIIN